MSTHWLTTYNPRNGDPIGSVCDCPIGDDHDGDGELDGEDYDDTDPPAPTR